MTAPPRRRWPRLLGRLLARLLGLAAVAYAIVCGVVFFAQDGMIYPAARGRGRPPTPFHLGPVVRRVDLTTAGGTHVVAAFAAAADADGTVRPDAAGRPTVLFFCGNGGTVDGSWPQVDGFRRVGANVLIPDYPGYGASDGRPGEAAIYATADAADDYLHRCPDVDATKVIAAGWSLGGAVAIDLAARRPVAGLAVFNAFTSMPEMAAKVMPWVPARLLCRPRYASESKMPRVRCPTLVCNGRLDTYVPPSMSDRLAAAAGGPVTRLVIDTADHNGIFDAEPETVWPAVEQLVETVASDR